MIDTDKILSIIKSAKRRCGTLSDFRNKCNLLNQKKIEYYKVIVGSRAYIIKSNTDFIYFYHDDWNAHELASLCRSASLDANKFLKSFNYKNQSVFNPINDYNINAINNSIGGTIKSFDMNACYWNIAKNLNVITEKTFIKGMNMCKDNRLIALGSFSKIMTISHVKNSKTIDKLVYKSPKVSVWHRILQEVDRIYNQTVDIVGLENYLMWRTDEIYFRQSKTSELTKWFKSENITTTKDTIKIDDFQKSTLSGIYLSRPIEKSNFNISLPYFGAAYR